jgi:hypothetical protein
VDLFAKKVRGMSTWITIFAAVPANFRIVSVSAHNTNSVGVLCCYHFLRQNGLKNVALMFQNARWLSNIFDENMTIHPPAR